MGRVVEINPSPLVSEEICEAYLARLSGFRISHFPRLPVNTVAYAEHVPGYSGGPATVFHRLSSLPDNKSSNVQSILCSKK